MAQSILTQRAGAHVVASECATALAGWVGPRESPEPPTRAAPERMCSRSFIAEVAAQRANAPLRSCRLPHAIAAAQVGQLHYRSAPPDKVRASDSCSNEKST